jgi:hypothetical protein
MIQVDFSQLKKAKVQDYLIRFVIGGCISVAASLIALGTNERFGGIFVAFPAILLASLTLIGRCEGRKKAEADAKGGVAGAVALVVTTIVLSLTLSLLVGVESLFLALAIWLICGIGLYFVAVKLGWLHPEQEES